MELCDLPSEVLMQVAEGLKDDDLKNLWQVNKFLNGIASSRLFKTITLVFGSSKKWKENHDALIQLAKEAIKNPAYLSSGFFNYPRHLNITLTEDENSGGAVEFIGTIVLPWLDVLVNLETVNFCRFELGESPGDTSAVVKGLEAICARQNRLSVEVSLWGFHPCEGSIIKALSGLSALLIAGEPRNDQEGVQDFASMISRCPGLKELNLMVDLDLQKVLRNISADQMPNLRSLSLDGVEPPWEEQDLQKLRYLEELQVVGKPWLDSVKRKRMWLSMFEVGITLDKLSVNSVELSTLTYLDSSASMLAYLNLSLPHMVTDMGFTVEEAENVATLFWRRTMPLVGPNLRQLGIFLAENHVSTATEEEKISKKEVSRRAREVCELWSLHRLVENLENIELGCLTSARLMVTGRPSRESNIMEHLTMLLLKAKRLRMNVVRLYFVESLPLPRDTSREECDLWLQGLRSIQMEISSWQPSRIARDGVFLDAMLCSSNLRHWVRYKDLLCSDTTTTRIGTFLSVLDGWVYVPESGFCGDSDEEDVDSVSDETSIDSEEDVAQVGGLPAASDEDGTQGASPQEDDSQSGNDAQERGTDESGSETAVDDQDAAISQGE